MSDALFRQQREYARDKTIEEIYRSSLSFSEIKDIKCFKVWLVDSLECIYKQGFADGLYASAHDMGAAMNKLFSLNDSNEFVVGLVGTHMLDSAEEPES